MAGPLLFAGFRRSGMVPPSPISISQHDQESSQTEGSARFDGVQEMMGPAGGRYPSGPGEGDSIKPPTGKSADFGASDRWPSAIQR